jgi:hypothetical protein
MSWRFRRSFKVIPGVRINLSKTGLSASIGGGPFTLNVGPRGVHGTASLPGSGISVRHRLSGEAHQNPVAPSPLPSRAIPPLRTLAPAPRVEEVRSASTEALTSESLKELKRVIETAYQERDEISRELETANQEKRTAYDKHFAWQNGSLLKHIFKKKFAQRKAALELAEAKVAELEQQLRLTTIATHVEIAKEQAEPYFLMRDEFSALCECEAIWDVKSRQATDKIRDRTIAEMGMRREKVTFSLGSSDLIQWEQKVPHLQNANGGDLFLYPGFILYRASKGAFAVIDFHDVKAVFRGAKTLEEQSVPKDSKTIGETWAKVNADGTRDRRFANNYQIPIVYYAWLTLKSDGGLWEEYLFSNFERLEKFDKALNRFVESFGKRA